MKALHEFGSVILISALLIGAAYAIVMNIIINGGDPIAMWIVFTTIMSVVIYSIFFLRS